MRMPKTLHTSVNMKPYLPTNAQEKLRTYVYKGEDRSLLYKHMWRPLCRAIAPNLPYWLAPNVITITALFVVILNHIALYQYLPNLKPEVDKFGECPWYVLVFAACGLLVYQLLDNLDGHQARRLGVSSPLGLLMDHGCDAFNCIIGALSICCATGLGATWKSWWVVLSTLITFFMNTWEEYYRGELILPQFNGPNEGLLIAVAIYLTSAVKGISFWTNNFIVLPTTVLPWFFQRSAVHEGLLSLFRQTHFQRMGYLQTRPLESYVEDFITAVYSPVNMSDISGSANWYTPFGGGDAQGRGDENSIEIAFGTIFCLIMCFASAATVFGNIYQVAVAVRRQEAEHRHGRYTNRTLVSKLPFLHALTRLIPLTIVAIIANMWLAASPANIFQQHPRLFCWTVGLLFTKSAVHLMIAHLCSIEFHPFRRTLVPFFYVVGHFLFSIYKNHEIPYIDESVTLFEFLMLSAIPFGHLAVNVINEMSKTLDVPVFVVPKVKRIAARAAEEQERFLKKKKSDVSVLEGTIMSTRSSVAGVEGINNRSEVASALLHQPHLRSSLAMSPSAPKPSSAATTRTSSAKPAAQRPTAAAAY